MGGAGDERGTDREADGATRRRAASEAGGDKKKQGLSPVLHGRQDSSSLFYVNSTLL